MVASIPAPSAIEPSACCAGAKRASAPSVELTSQCKRVFDLSDADMLHRQITLTVAVAQIIAAALSGAGTFGTSLFGHRSRYGHGAQYQSLGRYPPLGCPGGDGP